jgi:drug/metabolite transporter (DMT)-like permease
MERRAITAWLALGSVCLLWGTTYLGIRIALESFPPFYLMAFRYTSSGGLMVLVLRLMRHHLPTGRELRLTCLYGITTIGIGTGLLSIAEQWVPSGLAALFIATQPFWMVIMEWVLSRGVRSPHGPTLRGLLVGMMGVALLVLPSAIREGFSGGTFVGFLLLQAGCVGWVTGALKQKGLRTSVHPIVIGAVQQLATGLCFFALAGFFEHPPRHVTVRAAGGIAYLTIFGAIVGYSAFVYAMDRLPATIVSIYTFVNPVVAVILGWLFFREPFGPRELFAMLLIFAGVALVKFSASRDSELLVDDREGVVAHNR